jgi:nitroimidazol reductase NimA-like FMN-containing flavoprotein (pyridoxamine 5'-phosphate oxidase superfamily)
VAANEEPFLPEVTFDPTGWASFLRKRKFERRRDPLSAPTGRLEILSTDECLRLLAKANVGRVVLSMSALPAALPVNYQLVDGLILFFTAEGMKLFAALRNSVVGFEVDAIQEESETGWLVLAVGHAAEVTDTRAISTARQAGLRPWASADRSRLISIVPEIVTGRRLSQPYGQTPLSQTGQ